MKIYFFRTLIFLFIIFTLGVFFLSLDKSKIYDTKNIIGQNLHNFELKSLSGFETINEQDLKKNKFTLLNFWASWCEPCHLEHIHLMNLKENDTNLKILGINFKDKKNNALNFLSDHGNPYYLTAKDKDGKIAINFGVYGIPESILVNKDLVVIKKFIGPLMKEDYREILQLIK
tara:strand:- start:1457 stop:1978 length:522 start_codon:yes stop_codon:yes gene_type:complete